jgi:hypothetical protein
VSSCHHQAAGGSPILEKQASFLTTDSLKAGFSDPTRWQHVRPRMPMQATGQSRTRPISRNRERVSRTGLLCGRAAEVIGPASTGDFKVLAAETTKLGVRSSNLFGLHQNATIPNKTANLV